MKAEYKDKVCLITGGGSGMGRVTAQLFAQEGAKVVVADLNTQGGEETVQLIQKENGEAIFSKCNISKAQEVETLIEKIIRKYGKLDCAVNNAGIGGKQAPIHEITEEDWNTIITVNLKGCFLSMKYEIPAMIKAGRGAIVNICSTAGIIGAPMFGGYVASKHGIIGLTKTAALENARTGIRINSICPGDTKTPMTESLSQEMKDSISEAVPLGRMANPEEIAATSLWLCSDAASFITGHQLVVDGGFTIQ